MKRVPQHFVTTWPRKTQCPKCGRTILDGLDQGLPYRIDPIPLTITGELTAHLLGKHTYRLLANHITTRTTDDITAETPGTRPCVYATHHCAPPDQTHISASHVTETQCLITDKYLETSTEKQDNDQQALLTITDILNGKVISSPDDEDPPF